MYATSEDYGVCEDLHRKHGTTYYFATKRFPREIQAATHAVYGFVRVPDEWVDNPGEMSLSDRRGALQDWRNQLRSGVEGVAPRHPVMRAFCDTLTKFQIPLEEALVFLDAMEMDLTISRYETFDDLLQYTRGSAAAVGVMMLSVLQKDPTDEQIVAAKHLGDAMQLTNFMRDVAEDTLRNRIYLPLEDLRRYGVTEDDITSKRFSNSFSKLMEFQICRTRKLYAAADPGIRSLNPDAKQAVLLARILYSQILEQIEALDYNVFSARARTTKWQKLSALAKVALAPEKVLDELGARSLA
ncbi:MAG: phytoene/squalene synthase family protein [Fimbriimonadaceae bacterium]|jgi:phytoene synthase|nr:phytoene/squalene synthase family protein [Fimbriimonadaceae bacterium]